MVVVAKEVQEKEVFRNVEMMVSISSLRRGSRLVQLTIRVWSTGHLAPTESSVEGREAGLGNCSVSSSAVRIPKLYTSIFVVSWRLLGVGGDWG